jgi:Chaperone of endosialidase
MNPLIQCKTTILPLLIAGVLACFGLLPKADALVPAPDGGYPGFNTAEGQNALFSLTTGQGNTAAGWFALESLATGNFNTAIGAAALVLNTGDQNTATGAGALFLNTIGTVNTANGAFALFSNTTGLSNVANGYQALFDNTTGGQNTAIGNGALFSNTFGNGNIALGVGAGFSLTTGDSNIDIGSFGVTGESATIRIGAGGSQTRAFIAGIRGVTTGNADAIQVMIDSAGQLGTVSSSRRYKTDIKPMDKGSESILALKPVSFRYKAHKDATPQFGLIAEEVAEVNPDLVVRDEKGEIYTVRYDAVNAMLLNEFLKEHRRVEEQQGTIGQLKSNAAKQEATISELKKDMGVLTAQLKEQTAQIQKVSAQLEMNHRPPRMVVNNH